MHEGGVWHCSPLNSLIRLQQLLSILHAHRQLLLAPSCQQLQGCPCNKQFLLLGVALHDALRQGCSRQGGNSLAGQAGRAGTLDTEGHVAVGSPAAGEQQ